MISIIIPTYNRAGLISDTIHSLLNQSFSDFEIIVVDDHSSDNTKSVVNRIAKVDSRLRYYLRPDYLKKGGNSCRNFGLSVARGDYIKWLDSDDLLLPAALEQQYKSLDNTEFDLSVCESLIFKNDNPEQITGKWGNITDDLNLSNFISATVRWHTASGLWRKSIFSDQMVWQEGLANSQEWLMHLSQLIKGVKIIKVEIPLCLIRSHAGSMSHKNNKSAHYYYNEVKARQLVFSLFNSNSVRISQSARRKISTQFLLYHLFILYKLGLIDFIRAIVFYPVFLKYQLRNRK